jgi:hypothetical protein
MLRKLRPANIIEIGSGFSSAATLDTCDALHLDTRLTCIEPYPAQLEALLHKIDAQRVELIPQRVQDVDLALYDRLGPGDILFVDSTHIVKIGSDVQYILFEVLPRLRDGVFIHFHDIFYPFEYPREWVFTGRSWNEAYVLRALLAHSAAYHIVLFNTFLEHFHRAFFREHMPICLNNTGGSLWLYKGSASQIPL